MIDDPVFDVRCREGGGMFRKRQTSVNMGSQLTCESLALSRILHASCGFDLTTHTLHLSTTRNRVEILNSLDSWTHTPPLGKRPGTVNHRLSVSGIISFLVVSEPCCGTQHSRMFYVWLACRP